MFAGLDEFFDYKNKLIEDLLTSEEIVRLLDSEMFPPTSAEQLVYKQVFPYEYLPETSEHGKTYICCEVDIREVFNKTFLNPTLYIWVFTHKSKLRLPEGGVRIDKLSSEIDKIINGSRYYGFGELALYSVKRFTPIDEYQGRALTYQARDWNRTHPTGKPVPANRKGIANGSK